MQRVTIFYLATNNLSEFIDKIAMKLGPTDLLVEVFSNQRHYLF